MTGKQEVVAVQSRLLVRDSSVTASAFIVTYVVKLPTSRLLARGDVLHSGEDAFWKWVTSELPVIRPESRPSDEITFYWPTYRDLSRNP
jgi:hypothetical protein